MANRSYLYAFDRFEAGLPEKPRGMHEWNRAIPPTHLILMSGKPRTYGSSAEIGRKVAIVADREPGVTRLLAFLRALDATGVLDESFAKDVREVEAFLASDKGAGKFFLLEPFELFAMAKKDWEAQCTDVVQKQIPTVAAQVDDLIARPPDQFFKKPSKWLSEVREAWGMKLGLGSWGPSVWLGLKE